MTPADIRAARKAAGLTQAQAAELVGLGHANRWQEYESGERTPSGALWELFLLRTHQHPTHCLTKRRGAIVTNDPA